MLLLDAEGKGHYVGCNLNIHNLRSGPNLISQRLSWPIS